MPSSNPQWKSAGFQGLITVRSLLWSVKMDWPDIVVLCQHVKETEFLWRQHGVKQQPASHLQDGSSVMLWEMKAGTERSFIGYILFLDDLQLVISGNPWERGDLKWVWSISTVIDTSGGAVNADHSAGPYHWHIRLPKQDVSCLQREEDRRRAPTARVWVQCNEQNLFWWLNIKKKQSCRHKIKEVDTSGHWWLIELVAASLGAFSRKLQRWMNS